MSFVGVTGNGAQSTSPTHHTSESKTSSAADKKQFSLGNLTGKIKPLLPWKFSRTKDVDNGSSVPLQTRWSHHSDARCHQKPQHHGRHSPTDLVECLDRVEKDTMLNIKKDEDIRVLRERYETQYQQIKALEKQTTDLNEQVKHFQSEHYVEMEDNKALKVEIERLRRQLAAQTSVSCLEDTNSEEETIANYKEALTSLKNQIDDLNDDLTKLRDHSKEQSRQILKLRQQAEMIEPMETQIKSEITIRQKAEEESEMLREELKKATVTVNSLQTERKTLDTELKAMKEESARFIKDQNELNDLRKKYANLDDEHQQILKSMRAMGTLSAQLADSERAGRVLEQQLASTLLEKNELRDRIQAVNAQLVTHQEGNEDLNTQLVEHQETLSAVEMLNEKLTKEARSAMERCQGLEQDIQAKSSQVKQYAKEIQRLKQQLQGNAQGAGSGPMRAYKSPENDTGFAKVNDLYEAAMDDIARLSNENSELYDQIEELKEANAYLREKCSSNVQKVIYKHGLTIQDGISNGVPQVPTSPTSTRESHVTIPSAQQAGNVAESQQIIISAPLPVIPHTSGTASAPQSLPNQCGKIVTPEMLVDNYSALQQAKDAVTPLPPSEAETAPKPLHFKSLTESDENELEHVVSESSHQPFPDHDPVGQSNDSQQDIHYEASNIEDSMAQYENPLQKEVDDEIHQQAAQVIQEVGGGRRDANTDPRRPFDPNLVCPMCRKKFRIGEIQKFKKHVSTCTGTDHD